MTDSSKGAETVDVCAELVVPLLVERDVWGALNVEEIAPDAFDHDDVILLSTVANQVSAALRAARLVERLERAQALARRGEQPGTG